MKVRQAVNGTYFTKEGMTSVISESGVVIPVTVLKRIQNDVISVSTEEEGKSLLVFKGYYGRFNKPQAEMLKQLKEKNTENSFEIPNKGFIKEIKLDKSLTEVSIDFFIENSFIDVSAYSKGKGFQGGMKRHGFKGGRASHGCSLAHRTLGSTGNRHLPSKTIKGRKMAGHMGNKLRTQQNLQIVRILKNDDVLLVRGSVPGPRRTIVFARKAVKSAK